MVELAVRRRKLERMATVVEIRMAYHAEGKDFKEFLESFDPED